MEGHVNSIIIRIYTLQQHSNTVHYTSLHLTTPDQTTHYITMLHNLHCIHMYVRMYVHVWFNKCTRVSYVQTVDFKHTDLLSNFPEGPLLEECVGRLQVYETQCHLRSTHTTHTRTHAQRSLSAGPGSAARQPAASGNPSQPSQPPAQTLRHPGRHCIERVHRVGMHAGV